jgi:hypothetical protein
MILAIVDGLKKIAALIEDVFTRSGISNLR